QFGFGSGEGRSHRFLANGPAHKRRNSAGSGVEATVYARPEHSAVYERELGSSEIRQAERRTSRGLLLYAGARHRKVAAIDQLILYSSVGADSRNGSLGGNDADADYTHP